uniref:Uncharacterized protein n=1 Tax=Arcella intermedia TaxID=1963864 RepID=A0A6B2LC75_9EUKA
MDETFVKGLFDKYGGIPRYIFSPKDAWAQVFEGTLNSAKLDDIRQSLGGPELVRASNHKLLQYSVGEDYSTCTVKLASEYVEKRLIEKFYQQNRQQVFDFIKESKDQPMIAAIRGCFFESVAHTILRSFGKFSYRSVDSPVVLEMKLKVERKISFDKLEEIQLSEGTYYQPKFKNYPAIDSFCVVGNDIFLFQMTVSLAHPVLHSDLENTIKFFLKLDEKLSFKLVFVVPEDKFSQFTKQHYIVKKGEQISQKSSIIQSIPQFVLKIPYITGIDREEIPEE